MTPKVLVLRTAGTNCDYETEYGFQLAGAGTARVHINQLIAGNANLAEYHILVLPGGFSYGDDVSAGILLANEIRHKLGDPLREFVDSGKLIIGICNGFQTLVRAGLLPGINSQITQEATLAANASGKFECRWVNLYTQQSACVFMNDMKWRLYLPVAHAEGRFTAPSRILNQLESNRQVALRYGSDDTSIDDYPFNPNGSDNNIAAVCDPTGRILGMMPHPERYLARLNHPRWMCEDLIEKGDGFGVFRSAVAFARRNFS